MRLLVLLMIVATIGLGVAVACGVHNAWVPLAVLFVIVEALLPEPPGPRRYP